MTTSITVKVQLTLSLDKIKEMLNFRVSEQFKEMGKNSGLFSDTVRGYRDIVQDSIKNLKDIDSVDSFISTTFRMSLQEWIESMPLSYDGVDLPRKVLSTSLDEED